MILMSIDLVEQYHKVGELLGLKIVFILLKLIYTWKASKDTLKVGSSSSIFLSFDPEQDINSKE